MLAAKAGQVKAVEVLMLYGANRTLVNDDAKTALGMASNPNIRLLLSGLAH